MNKKEVSEIRKKFPECISRISLCYANADREIVLSETHSAGTISEEMMDTYVSLLKNGLTGKIESGLLTLRFPMEGESEGEEQENLCRVVRTEMNDPDSLSRYHEDVVSCYDIAGNFLILSAYCVYDVPMKTSDDNTYDDMGDVVYRFIISCVCPVEPVSPGLCYVGDKNEFAEKSSNWVVKKPETAILFPSFTDRTPNIHECLYSIRKAASPHPEFVENVLGCALPDSAQEQKEQFIAAVSEALGKEADLDTIRSIQQNLNDIAQERELNGEPTDISREDINRILRASGTERELEEEIDVKAANICEPKYTLEGDGIKIVVSSSRIDSICQKMDGRVPYIMIPMSEMTMNGMPIRTGNI